MSQEEYPESFLAYLRLILDKRPKVVIEHILRDGHITTEELQEEYGYNHPPRAIRDVIENGIPIERYTVRNAQGRPIAAYRFGDPAQLRPWMLGGRKALQRIKRQLQGQGGACKLCLTTFPVRDLQVDHRVPYQIAGETTPDEGREEFMLLCRPCNRAKSWACEHCDNWRALKQPELCFTCFWASPEMYSHIALTQMRRLELVWQAGEVTDFDQLRLRAEGEQASLSEYVKAILRKHLE